jgi:hypothetical protein
VSRTQTPPESVWQRLRAAALVGTARKSPPADTGLVPATEAEAPLALLDQAAAALVQRRAGMVPRAAALLTPAAPDPRPPVPQAAARRLQRILHDQGRRGMLAEWLQLAADHGYRLPSEALPQLFTSSGTAEHRAVIARLAGPRERWYVAQREVSAWRFLLDQAPPEDTDTRAIDAETWQDHAPAERRNALASLRRRDPAAARELLAAVWGGERSEQRRALLAVLEEGLGLGDEELLERALGDRSGAVRGTALRLLSRLSGSAHAGRLRERAHGTLSWNEDRDRIEVRLPDLSDTTLRRDLALAKPNTARPEETGWEWLSSLLVAVPLDVWTQELGADAATIIATVVDAQHWQLLAAFTESVSAQYNADWATVLYPLLIDLHHNDRFTVTRNGRREVITGSVLQGAVPHEVRCRATFRMLSDPQSPMHLPRDKAFSQKLQWDAMRERAGRLHEAVRHLEGPWTEELGALVLDLLGRVPPGSPQLSMLSPTFDVAAQRLPLQLRPQVPISPANTTETSPMATLAATLDFRLDMHKEFH